MSREINTVLTGMSYLECPRWHDDRIWVADFYRHQVVSATEDGQDLRVEAEVPQQPSGLGWLPDGRLLVVSMRDRKLLRREAGGELVVHADLADYVGRHPNDMVVDGQGRAYVGNFGFDLMGGADIAPSWLVRVDPDGSVTRVAEDFVAADGCALDAEGALWIADALHGRVTRVLEGGQIVAEIIAGVGVFACGLGGADGRTLFICTAPDFDERARAAAREAQLLSTRVEVPHAGGRRPSPPGACPGGAGR
jgi:sugar lactone lactonase YvrE